MTSLPWTQKSGPGPKPLQLQGALQSCSSSFISILTVLAILVVLVVIHELGHFVVARRAKVRVHEFGIGFPPRARILGRDKETIYTLNWLPLGGFVRLEGEEGESDDPRAFVNARLRTRLAILFAGVGMNFVLAFVIFAVIAGVSDPVTNVQLGCVVPGSPAAQIGLVGGKQVGTTASGVPQCDGTGDAILAMDGQRFPAFDDMASGDAPLRYLRSHAGQTVTLTIRHADGTVEDKTVQLRVPQNGEGALGVAPYALTRDDQITHDPLTAVSLGFHRTVDASTLILRTLGDLVNVNSLTNPPVSGPIGIVTAVDAVRTQLPPVFLFWLIGLLSANLAVVNLLPLPPLDGGRIFMSVLQKVTGNRVNPSFERAFYLAASSS